MNISIWLYFIWSHLGQTSQIFNFGVERCLATLRYTFLKNHRLANCTFTFDMMRDGTTEGPGTIHILSDGLPKIIPYVLINHREELLPLMMCVSERHPDSDTRDSLTHTLFNLIKRYMKNKDGLLWMHVSPLLRTWERCGHKQSCFPSVGIKRDLLSLSFRLLKLRSFLFLINILHNVQISHIV